MTEKITEEQIEKLRSQVEVLHETLASWHRAGIPEKTLIVLLNHYTKVPQRTIKLVLEGMDALIDEYFTEEDDE